MINPTLRVGIAGGGIGGLCLAQGLKKAGIDVVVFERDRTRTDRLQGYRIHISPKGSRALHDCLPPALYDAFVATCGKEGGRIRFLTEKMQELLVLEAPPQAHPIERHHSASRITLRQVLLSGLDDVVRFGKTFTHYTQEPDGRVTAHFEDGDTATIDILIGADGGNSRVRRQFLPHAQRLDTGVVGLAGKMMLTDENRARLPISLLRGTGLVMAPGRNSMFLALQEFAETAAPDAAIGGNDEAARLQPGAHFDNTTSYLMWAYGGYRDQIENGRPLEDMGGEALRALVLAHVDGWHEDFRKLVSLSDPSTINVLKIKTSVPVAPWPTARITLLGDAIHAMTPYRGIGANIALRDAALLCRNLIAVQRHERTLEDAIHDYETAMRAYGFKAVQDSLKAMNQSIGAKGLGFALTKLFFRAANALPPLKRLAFSDFGND